MRKEIYTPNAGSMRARILGYFQFFAALFYRKTAPFLVWHVLTQKYLGVIPWPSSKIKNPLLNVACTAATLPSRLPPLGLKAPLARSIAHTISVRAVFTVAAKYWKPKLTLELAAGSWLDFLRSDLPTCVLRTMLCLISAQFYFVHEFDNAPTT
jgi:hypothetical protein